VLRLRASSETPASALVVEVQLHVDDDKRFVWPLYVAGLRARLRCPVALVVLTLDDRVARWAATPIGLDERGSVLRPWVVGPAEVPAITEVADAAALPEFALLSVLAHGREPGAERLGRGLLEASRDPDDARGRLYTDIVFSFLDDAARAILEAELQLPGYTYQSDFARRFVSQGREEGRVETLVAGLSVERRGPSALGRRPDLLQEQPRATMSMYDADLRGRVANTIRRNNYRTLLLMQRGLLQAGDPGSNL